MKKIILALLTFSLAVSCAMLTACGEKQPPAPTPSVGLSYRLTKDANDAQCYAVAGLGTCTDTVITIPSTHEGLPVTIIGEEAFEFDDDDGLQDTITKFNIPSSITSIGKEAFDGRKGEINFINPTITIIDNGAFKGYLGNGGTFTIPNSVTTIGSNAFSLADKEINEDAITKFVIPSSVTAIYDSAFACRTSEIEFINPTITSLSYGAFRHYLGNGGTFTIPNTVTYIARETFSLYDMPGDFRYAQDNIAKIIIPNSVEEIDWYAFKDRKAEIEFDNPTITTIHERAFAEYRGTSFTIPRSVTTIGKMAFSSCTNITSITVPNTVTSIGLGAFSIMRNLTSFEFEDGTQIEELPFALLDNCIKLTTVEIPASVKRLTCEESISPTNTYIGTFRDMTATITFEEGSMLESIAKYYFVNFKGTVILPDCYTSIDLRAFYGNNGAKIVVPATVTYIDEHGLAYYDQTYHDVHEIFFEGTAEQWNTLLANSHEFAVDPQYSDVLPNIYVSGNWQMIDGVPTPNAN